MRLRPTTKARAAGAASSPDLLAEEAGAREAFEDAALYDWEYRRRRHDVRFYQRIAAERTADAGPGLILDLACGSGRLMAPLLRDGHSVVGIDRSRAMLDRAAWRLSNLSRRHQARGLLAQGDLRRFAVARGRFTLALCVFHSVQHLVSDREVVAFLRCVRRALLPDGWLAFDLLPPAPEALKNDPTRRWARTVFRHPTTGQRLIYTSSQAWAADRRAMHMRFYYQPVDARGVHVGRERAIRLCHRQFTPDEIARLLAKADFRLMASFGAFDGRPLDPADPACDQHIYVARPTPRPSRK